MSEKSIYFYEVRASTHAAQGDTASGLPGYEIWLVNEDKSQDFLGWIPFDMFMVTVDYYQKRGDKCYAINLKDS